MSEYSGSRLLAFDLALRRAAAAPGGELASLADGLSAELAPLLERELPIPDGKARLTRIGGRCPIHGDLLEFDPYAPRTHRCTRCGRDYTGQEHDDWWAMGAGLWTAERAVHAAALYLLRGDPAHAALSGRILSALADRYMSWPNVDNVLGPSRPFFSTYLESIWLLNICHALDLLQTADAPDVGSLSRHVRQALIKPSAALIAGFPEGASNRQVWNEIAILSAMTMLDQDDAIDQRLDSEEGILGIMTDGLLDDGTWYEGENYHLFAHRGLWYAVEMMRARSARGHINLELPEELGHRYAAGFPAPFAGVLPDDTFPSRRDSKYAVSIHQWRIAEWCELGYAHSGDVRLAGVLTRLYDKPSPSSPGETGAFTTERARSTADAERSAPPTALSRASLSWRALLMANVEAPPPAPWQRGSVLLPSQGLAVIRRDEGRVYVALEGGHTGGGHGHPDRLALTLQRDDVRWLEDPGTGSYVERALHWYRSTLAHAAPLIDGASQELVPATLIAFEDRGGAGWVSKRVDGMARGVSVVRTVVVCDSYLVDLLEWEADDARDITLPIAGQATVREQESALGAPWTATDVTGAGGLEDGFDFAERAESRPLPARGTVVLDATGAAGQHDERARLWYMVSSGQVATLVRATVPGPPGTGPMQRHWLSATGARGFAAGVWSWTPEDSVTGVASVAFGAAGEPLVSVTTRDGTCAHHARAPHGWNIELVAGGARSSIGLGGLANAVPAEPEVDADDDLDDAEGTEPHSMFADYDVPWTDEDALPDPAEAEPGAPIDDALLLPLGSSHYMRTEQTWEEAGEPTAMLQLARTDRFLIVDIEVATGAVVAPTAGPDGTLHNPLDNEIADVNADGVQWYVGKPDDGRWTAAGMLVPAPSPRDPVALRAHRLSGDGTVEPSCSWTPVDGGWAMRIVWPLASLPADDDGCIAFDLVVNERPPERERRRGQLVLSGGGGFAYLQGDRQDPAGAVIIAVT